MSSKSKVNLLQQDKLQELNLLISPLPVTHGQDRMPHSSGVTRAEHDHGHATILESFTGAARKEGVRVAGAEEDDITIVSDELETIYEKDEEKRAEAVAEKEAEAEASTDPTTMDRRGRENTNTSMGADEIAISTDRGATSDARTSTLARDSLFGPTGRNSSVPSILPYEKLAQKNPKPTDHMSMTIGPPMIILFDIVVPCIIYYVWFDIHRAKWVDQYEPYNNRNEPCPIPKPEYDGKILGYAIISFGFGELYILIARVARLLYHRDLCAPLLSRSKWELDATSWVYGVAMLMALIPFVVGSTLEIGQLYLYSPGFLMAFLGILMLVTLIPVKIPIGVNSHARGTSLRPFIYCAAEDFIAVDGLQDREFRVRYNARYDSSEPFRRMFLVLTFWWIAGVIIYLGCLSAVIWTLEFHYAFGLSFGVLFSYILIWAGVSYYYVMIEMDLQKKAYESEALEAKC